MLLHAAALSAEAGGGPAPVHGASSIDIAAAHAPTGIGSLALPVGAVAPSVVVFDQGLGFPVPFERAFDFDQLPFAGEYRDVTLEGIRLRANGLRHWVHLDGSPLVDRAARQPDAAERWTIDLPPGSHALEFRMWESTIPGVGVNTCYNFDFCSDTLYRVRVFGDAGVLLRDFDFSPFNNRTNTVAIWSSAPIASVVLTAELNNVDDEFLGDLRVATTPLPAGLRYVPSRQHGGFGRHAALAGMRAVIADAQGFELWRRSGPDGWAFAGRRDVTGTIERIAMDAGIAAVAVATPGGPRLRIHEIQGDDPASWPVTEIPYAGVARDLAVEGDIVMLGVDGEVRIHQRQAGLGWVFVYALAPDPPIVGADQYGRDLGLDQGRLVVNAGRGLFHVYERGIGAVFNEVYRQEESFTSRSYVDISGTTVAVQTFEGGLRLYSADPLGVWSVSGAASGSLPPEIGLGTGAAVRIDGDTLLTLQDFQASGSPEFRQVVSVWSRTPGRQLVRAAVFVDPHLPPAGTARLGAFGQAFEIDGDDVLLGQPQTHWCDYGDRAFIGDSGPLGFASVCGSRSGAVFFASAGGLATLFASGFEP
jgi:hypothetical protein